MAMELVTLGSSASFPEAGGACSGYLIERGDTRLLLDCGSGVLSQLQKVTPMRSLSAIVITHFHPDHYIDLVPMRYGLHYGIEDPFTPIVYLPPDGIALLQRVGIGLRNSQTYFSAAFDLREYNPNASLTIDGLSLTFQRTTHDEPTWAVAVDDGETRFVYTSDTRESDDVLRFARGADLLLSEATYPEDLGELPSDTHLTSRQAGTLAREAGARRLMLTHFWPGIDRARFLAEARAEFAGPIDLAAPGARFAIEKTPDVMLTTL